MNPKSSISKCLEVGLLDMVPDTDRIIFISTITTPGSGSHHVLLNNQRSALFPRLLRCQFTTFKIISKSLIYLHEDVLRKL